MCSDQTIDAPSNTYGATHDANIVWGYCEMFGEEKQVKRRKYQNIFTEWNFKNNKRMNQSPNVTQCGSVVFVPYDLGFQSVKYRTWIGFASSETNRDNKFTPDYQCKGDFGQVIRTGLQTGDCVYESTDDGETCTGTYWRMCGGRWIEHEEFDEVARISRSFFLRYADDHTEENPNVLKESVFTAVNLQKQKYIVITPDMTGPMSAHKEITSTDAEGNEVITRSCEPETISKTAACTGCGNDYVTITSFLDEHDIPALMYVIPGSETSRARVEYLPEKELAFCTAFKHFIVAGYRVSESSLRLLVFCGGQPPVDYVVDDSAAEEILQAMQNIAKSNSSYNRADGTYLQLVLKNKIIYFHWEKGLLFETSIPAINGTAAAYNIRVFGSDEQRQTLYYKSNTADCLKMYLAGGLLYESCNACVSAFPSNAGGNYLIMVFDKDSAIDLNPAYPNIADKTFLYRGIEVFTGVEFSAYGKGTQCPYYEQTMTNTMLRVVSLPGNCLMLIGGITEQNVGKYLDYVNIAIFRISSGKLTILGHIKIDIKQAYEENVDCRIRGQLIVDCNGNVLEDSQDTPYDLTSMRPTLSKFISDYIYTNLIGTAENGDLHIIIAHIFAERAENRAPSGAGSGSSTFVGYLSAGKVSAYTLSFKEDNETTFEEGSSVFAYIKSRERNLAALSYTIEGYNYSGTKESSAVFAEPYWEPRTVYSTTSTPGCYASGTAGPNNYTQKISYNYPILNVLGRVCLPSLAPPAPGPANSAINGRSPPGYTRCGRYYIQTSGTTKRLYYGYSAVSGLGAGQIPAGNYVIMCCPAQTTRMAFYLLDTQGWRLYVLHGTTIILNKILNPTPVWSPDATATDPFITISPSCPCLEMGYYDIQYVYYGLKKDDAGEDISGTEGYHLHRERVIWDAALYDPSIEYERCCDELAAVVRKVPTDPETEKIYTPQPVWTDYKEFAYQDKTVQTKCLVLDDETECEPEFITVTVYEWQTGTYVDVIVVSHWKFTDSEGNERRFWNPFNRNFEQTLGEEFEYIPFKWKMPNVGRKLVSAPGNQDILTDNSITGLSCWNYDSETVTQYYSKIENYRDAIVTVRNHKHESIQWSFSNADPADPNASYEEVRYFLMPANMWRAANLRNNNHDDKIAGNMPEEHCIPPNHEHKHGAYIIHNKVMDSTSGGDFEAVGYASEQPEGGKTPADRIDYVPEVFSAQGWSNDARGRMTRIENQRAVRNWKSLLPNLPMSQNTTGGQANDWHNDGNHRSYNKHIWSSGGILNIYDPELGIIKISDTGVLL
jgi:hypothetical protein